MSKSNENKLVPRLRFPEFENKGDWTEKKLAEFDELVSGDGNWILSKDITSNGEFKIVQLSSIGFGVFKEKVLKTISSETFFELNGTPIQKEDLLINRMVDSNKINCCIFPYDGKYVTSVDVCWIRSNCFIDNYFLMGLLCEKSNQIKLLSLSSGAGRVRISKKNLFEKFDFLLPPNFKEQQKIASCLSSLDKVITAESQKLEVLKEHKKGLLQNLFPQNGEKVPKMRFKEFENEGKWEIKELNELGVLINGLTYSPDDVREEGLLVLRSSNIQNGLIDLNDCVYVREDIKGANISKPNDILVCVRNGSKNLIGKNAIILKGIPFATHGAFMTVFRAINSEFVFQLFQTDSYNNQVKADLGATINSINGKNFLKYEFPIPKNSNEQQKIATCLSSLDETIQAQTEKIELLHLHKKGLLQGLFPKMND